MMQHKKHPIFFYSTLNVIGFYHLSIRNNMRGNTHIFSPLFGQIFQPFISVYPPGGVSSQSQFQPTSFRVSEGRFLSDPLAATSILRVSNGGKCENAFPQSQ